jgi:hypothetical protein
LTSTRRAYASGAPPSTRGAHQRRLGEVLGVTTVAAQQVRRPHQPVGRARDELVERPPLPRRDHQLPFIVTPT